jgi:hypothetical protein
MVVISTSPYCHLDPTPLSSRPTGEISQIMHHSQIKEISPFGRNDKGKKTVIASDSAAI